MLDKTLTHKTSTTTQDAIGGASQSFGTSNSDIPCALWGKSAGTLRDLGRDDIVGDHIIVTAQDLSVKSGDQLIISSVYYIVNGAWSFSNASVTSESLYVHDVTKRTV